MAKNTSVQGGNFWAAASAVGAPCAGSLLVLRPRVAEGADHVDKAANTNLVKTEGSVCWATHGSCGVNGTWTAQGHSQDKTMTYIQ